MTTGPPAPPIDEPDLVATASRIIGSTGGAFYFAPATVDRGTELGLDTLQFYVLGRGGVLGDVEAAVVRSAFGYFNPTMIERAWNAGRAVIAPRDAGREHMRCCAQHGRNRLAVVEGLDELVADAEAIKDAADPTGLALFAAIAAEPLADDAPGRALQLLAVLRELRGSAHLIALRAVGVDSKTAHFVKRPNDIRLFGWRAADAPEITDATHEAMAAAERLTDRIVAPAYAALAPERREPFVAALRRIETALSQE